MGVPFADLLAMCGGVRGGRKLKAVIPGGVSVPVVPGETMLKTNMDYDSVKAAGSALGSGAAIVMDETTCMVRVLERISRFYMSESCGQCTPCREGTGWMNRLLKRVLAGQSRREELALLLDVANRIEGHTICAFGDASAWPVQSFLKHYRHEFEYMIDHGGRSLVSDTMGGAGGVSHGGRPGQYRDRRRAGEGAQGRDDHPRHRRAWRLCAALLLPREAARSRPTAACAWWRWRRRPSRCRPARRPWPRA